MTRVPVRARNLLRLLPDDLRQVAGGGLINLAAAAINAVATFALFIVAEAFYPTEIVGAFVVAIAVFTILANVSQMGSQVGFVRFVARYREQGRAGDLRTLLTVGLAPVLVLGVAVAAVLVLSMDTWIEVFGRGEDAARVRDQLTAMAPFIPLGAVTLALAFGTQGFGTMIPAAITEKAGRPLAQLLLVAGLGLVGAELSGLSYGLPYLIAVAVLLPWILRLAKGASDGRSRTARWPPVAREFWSFAVPRGAASSFQVAIQWTDTILLGAMASTTQAGIYSIATRFLTIGHLAIGAMLQAAGPRLALILAVDDDDRANAVYRSTTWWIMAAVWPLYILVAVFHEPLLLILGENYLVAGPAVVILAVAMVIASGSGPVDLVLLMSGRSIWSMVNWLSSFAVNIGLNLWLIPRYGITGAAIAWAASILVRNVIPVIEVRVMLGLDPFGPGYAMVVGSAGAVLAIALGARATLGSGWLGLVVTSVLALAVHGSVLWRGRRRLLATS